MSRQAHPPSRRLLVIASIRRIISGLDLREPLHADGVDLCNSVLERDALELVLDLAIPENSFERDELPFWRVLANFERSLQA